MTTLVATTFEKRPISSRARQGRSTSKLAGGTTVYYVWARRAFKERSRVPMFQVLCLFDTMKELWALLEDTTPIILWSVLPSCL